MVATHIISLTDLALSVFQNAEFGEFPKEVEAVQDRS